MTWPDSVREQLEHDQREAAARRLLPERCTRCGLLVAAWRVEDDEGRPFCTSFCREKSR